MSILLLVMLLLAVFHYFYQSVVVKTNNELFDIDLDILKHEMDIYEIKHAKELNVSENEFLSDTKTFVNHCSEIGREFTAFEMIMDMSEHKTSKELNSEFKKMRSLKIQNEKIWDFNVAASMLIFRNISTNAGVFLFALSPLLFLVLIYSMISGKKLLIEQSLERISSKLC